MMIRDLDQPHYDHTQPGTVTRAICLLMMLWMLVFAIFASWGAYIVVGVLDVLLAFFHSLRVRIDDHSVELSFGIGLLKKSIPLDTIQTCTSVRNSLIHGFGIRKVPGGWMWNVSGLDSVQLAFADGKHFRIGTDEPAALEAAINRAIGNSTENDTTAD